MPLDLAPVAARLQFAVRPAGQQPTGADPFYLVPHGTFTVQPPAERAAALLCGVGGTEYVTLVPAATMTFVAGQPAFAPGFDPGQSTTAVASGPAAERPGLDLLGGGDRAAGPGVLRPARGRRAVRPRHPGPRPGPGRSGRRHAAAVLRGAGRDACRPRLIRPR